MVRQILVNGWFEDEDALRWGLVDSLLMRVRASE